MDYWMDEHNTLLFTDAESFIIAVAVPSRMFPLIPSLAVTFFLLTEFSIPSPQPCEKDCLLAMEWSAKLSEKIWQIAMRWPDHKPSVASIGDGLTSSLMHLSMLVSTAPSFNYDCRLKQDNLDRLRRVFGSQEEFDKWRQFLKTNPDMDMVDGLKDGGAWFRFESFKLSRAIFFFMKDPDAPSLYPYRPFLQVLHEFQHIKDNSTPHHRTVGTTVNDMAQADRDKAATRFATLVKDEIALWDV